MGYGILKTSGILQLFLDGVVDMDVGYDANGSGSKHPSSVYLSYFILSQFCSSYNFSERNDLASADVTLC